MLITNTPIALFHDPYDNQFQIKYHINFSCHFLEACFSKTNVISDESSYPLRDFSILVLQEQVLW